MGFLSSFANRSDSVPNLPATEDYRPQQITRKGGRTRKPDFTSERDRSTIDKASAGNQSRVGTVHHMSLDAHAAALLDLLQDADYPTGYQLNFKELRKIYREMCAQNRWRERGWISIGRAFDLLTTNGRKPYANFWNEEGRAQRLRVYPIPPKVPADNYAEAKRAAA